MNFAELWNVFAQRVYQNSLNKGFYEVPISTAEKIALIHSELSEALEALRKPETEFDAKCPDFLEVEVELADAVIRIMDMAAARGWRVAEAMEAKHEYNLTRPYKHGKRF